MTPRGTMEYWRMNPNAGGSASLMAVVFASAREERQARQPVAPAAASESHLLDDDCLVAISEWDHAGVSPGRDGGIGLREAWRAVQDIGNRGCPRRELQLHHHALLRDSGQVQHVPALGEPKPPLAHGEGGRVID